MARQKGLSEKSIAVLQLIATGHSYNQIVEAYRDITYLDIFAAAEDALRLNELQFNSESDAGYEARLAKIRAAHPKAYEPWTTAEDLELSQMHSQHKTRAEMSARLLRQPSAIGSRLRKLGLASIVSECDEGSEYGISDR